MKNEDWKEISRKVDVFTDEVLGGKAIHCKRAWHQINSRVLQQTYFSWSEPIASFILAKENSKLTDKVFNNNF